MRRRSVGVLAPSAVVENTNLPGISLVPGVPSTADSIRVASTKEVASQPKPLNFPRLSPLTTEASPVLRRLVPIVGEVAAVLLPALVKTPEADST